MLGRSNNHKIVTISQMFIFKWPFHCRCLRCCLSSPFCWLLRTARHWFEKASFSMKKKNDNNDFNSNKSRKWKEEDLLTCTTGVIGAHVGKLFLYSLAAACLALSAKSPMSAPIKLAKANNLLLSTQSLPKTNKIIDRPGHVKELCLSKQTTEFLGDLHTGLHYT